MDGPHIQHWLVSVAQAAELPGADVSGAWDLVAMTTGVSQDELARSVARHYRLEVADLTMADPHAHRIVPGKVARKWGILPVGYSDRRLLVATADPVSMEAEREISHVASRNVDFQVAPPGLIETAIEAAYPRQEVEHEIPPLSTEAKGGPHVLVVDDDADTRLLLRTVLESEGFRVAEAEDGPQALAALAGDDPFHLMTLDLNMPQMQGLEVLQTLRAQAPTADLPVVVATAAADPELEMQLFEAGADDYVVKPVDPPRFVLRVKAVLRRRSARPMDGLYF